jgi:hypothetical protein
MDQWINTFFKILNGLFFKPASMLELYIGAALAIVIGMLVLSKVATAFGANAGEFGRALVALPLALVVLFAGMVAARLYLAPALSDAPWVVPAVGVVVSLALVMPLLCAFLKMNYIGSLITWVVTFGAMMAIVYVCSIASDTFFSMKGSAGKAGERKDALQEYIDLQ